VVTSNDELKLFEPALLQALQSPNDWIREETIWFLLEAAARGFRGSGPLIAAALTHNENNDGWEALGRELLHARQRFQRVPYR
jgi:hypothetical protein